MSDVLWLHAHPGWSYADLMAAPDWVIEGLAMLDAEMVKQAKL